MHTKLPRARMHELQSCQAVVTAKIAKSRDLDIRATRKAKRILQKVASSRFESFAKRRKQCVFTGTIGHAYRQYSNAAP